MCQCPLGLMTHFYEDTKMEEERNELVSMPSRADDSFLLCLTFHRYQTALECVNALSGWWLISTPHLLGKSCLLRIMCQCPLGLMTHFYLIKREERNLWEDVSMPSRADDSFLRYPFKNLDFMRFPKPIFAGICQNILTGPLFRACLQFGHI